MLPTQPNRTPSTSDQPRAIEKLFHHMLCTYGKKFADQWSTVSSDDMKRHWSAQLAGYTAEEINRGVQALDTLEWPPTLPEFKRLCRPTIDPLVAFYEAQNGMAERKQGDVGQWSHPAIFWAAVKVGAYDILNSGYGTLKARWEKALADQMAKGEWADIPKPVAMLPPPGKTLVDRETADARLKELKAQDIVKSASSGTDHKAWAKKLLARHASGDKSLSMIQLRFAKEALDVRAS